MLTPHDPRAPEHDPSPFPAAPGGELRDDSVARLYEALTPVARGLVGRTGAGELEAVSVLNRVMVRWLPQRDRWRHRADEAKRYLITCIRNEIAGEMRRHRPARLGADPAAPEPAAPPDHDQGPIRAGLAAIDVPHNLRRIAILRCVEERSWADVAAAVGTTPDYAKTLWCNRRTVVVRCLLALAAGELGALNHVIARRLFIERAAPDAVADSLQLDRGHLADRIECEILPTLSVRFGAVGLDVLRRAAL